MNENNFTSCVWWVLIDEMAPRAEEMACEKEVVCCVRGYQAYKDTWAAAIGEVFVCSRESTNVGEILKNFRMFSVYENIFTTKKKANYVNCFKFIQMLA